MSEILRDPCETFANFVASATPPTIVPGRTGNGFQFTGSNTTGTFSIPTPSQFDTITYGFAWRTAALPAATVPINVLSSDAGATLHNNLRLSSTGALDFTRGTALTLGTLSGITIAVNTWYYIEVQAKLHDTAGTVTVRVDGTTRLALTSQDTKNAGTKTVYDTLRFQGFSAINSLVDDIYVMTGSGDSFQGPINIGARVKSWNGSAFVDAPVKAWNGSAFVDAVAVKTWNGSAFV